MLNLALYSDQIIAENAAIDVCLLRMMQSKGVGTRIGYIASGPEPERRFFNQRKRYYAKFGLNLTLFHDLDETHGPAEIADLFACDAIHLSGGKTLGFLERVKRSDMLNPLRSWALAGGILIGTSAGAILMTPTIAVDALFAGKRPEDDSGAAALDLLPFEFFPHLNADANYLPELIRYSRHTKRPILACLDGDGAVVTEQTVQCIGNPLWIGDGTTIAAREIVLTGLVVSR